MNIRAIASLGAAAIATALYLAGGVIAFAGPASKDEAVSMVQKAVGRHQIGGA
jgi:hypothetical protein